MYKIDWNKYLNTGRAREPQSLVGKKRPKDSTDMRSEFDSDFGRVIFCSASRRMHDKTQVFPLTSGDYIHTRLTHSMEVMNIAQSLAFSLCRNSDFVATYGTNYAFDLEQQISAILRTAALMHDIGNPPFGHYGEEMIQNYFERYGTEYLKGTEETNQMLLDFQQYDGNAQGFRTITKTQYLGDVFGLNLTYATLGAYMKYPNVSSKNKKGYVGEHKHGIFYSEKDVFMKVVRACNLEKEDKTIKRHPLAFLVEAADTICYRAMDTEDGIMSNKFSLDEVLKNVSRRVENNVNHADFEDWMMDETGHFSLEKLLKLRQEAYYPKRCVNFRVALINYFVNLALNNFIHNLESIDNGTYSEELLSDDPLKISDMLGNFQYECLYQSKEIISAELTGASVINGLLNIVLPKVMSYDAKTNKDIRIFSVMSDSELKLIHQECGLYDPQSKWVFRFEEVPPYYRLRYVVDWISGMTDKFALETYQKLSGMNL